MRLSLLCPAGSIETVAQFDMPQLKTEGAVRWSADSPGLDGTDRSGSQGIVYLHGRLSGGAFPLTYPSRHSVSDRVRSCKFAWSGGISFPLGIDFLPQTTGWGCLWIPCNFCLQPSNMQNHDISCNSGQRVQKATHAIVYFLGGKGKVLTAMASQKKAQMNTSLYHPVFGIGNRPKAGQNHLFTWVSTHCWIGVCLLSLCCRPRTYLVLTVWRWPYGHYIMGMGSKCQERTHRVGRLEDSSKDSTWWDRMSYWQQITFELGLERRGSICMVGRKRGRVPSEQWGAGVLLLWKLGEWAGLEPPPQSTSLTILGRI